MRSIWKGSIGFGLVNIPIKLFSAVQSSNLDLDMLDSKDHSKIHFQRVNEKTNKEVPFDKIVKGYKYNEEYIILEDKDFEDASPEKTKIIEIENFVELSEVNPMYFETSYYAQAEKQGLKAYSLLLKSLQKSNKAGLGRFVLRNNENLCIIHPVNEVIVITKIRFAEEIRDVEDILSPESISISKKELDMGLALINQYSDKFQIEQYRDEYHSELLKIIEAKAKGKRATIKKMKPIEATGDDLYDQLIQSLNGSSRKKGA
ncbi:non-homologous end joining protein Ku [Arcticibacter eurypsychrophilus]|uniref:non-homologous end joining protein Ku n=1 Tax=Arcticibacter eurypsychrophilus TaxID=1434752 RepID=UPI00084DD20A|nr:Ku protein [Arcticibacter eurypsychrophilus]